MTPVSKEQYFLAHQSVKMRVLSSFTDPDGVMYFSDGKPQMETDWGLDIDRPIARVISTKKDRHQKEWDCSYFLADALLAELESTNLQNPKQ